MTRRLARPMRQARGVAIAALLIATALAVTQAVVSAGSSAEEYDAGRATITQGAEPPDSKFGEMPVQLRGTIAVPEGEGPFPVVVFVHGSYPFCDVVSEYDVYPCPAENDLRQFEGFSYLAEALAGHGYITLVPDLSAEYNTGFAVPVFGERAIQIIDAHLDALASGLGFDDVIAARADLDRLSLVGHSRGGPIALRYITDETATRDVSALALLTPAFRAEEAKIPASMPTALVIAGCDGDVGTREPLEYRRKQLRNLRPTLTTTYTLANGTHNAFSTKLDLIHDPQCQKKELLPAEQQQSFAAAFVPDFLDAALSYGQLPVASTATAAEEPPQQAPDEQP